METKKKNVLINLLSSIITICILVVISIFYIHRINANILDLIKITLFSHMIINDVFILVNIYFLFKYVKTIIKLLLDKKICKLAIMTLISILLIFSAIYIVKYANSYLRLIAFNILIILEITIAPIIFLIMMINLSRKKNNKVKFILISLGAIALISRSNKMCIHRCKFSNYRKNFKKS